MSKTKWGIVVVLLFAAVMGAGTLIWRATHPEPAFLGQPVSAWLRQKAAQSNLQAVSEALQHIGPAAVPYIVDQLNRNSGLSRFYRQLWPRLPGFLRKHFPPPGDPFPEVMAVNAFRDIGPDVIPSLIPLLEHKNPAVRLSAVWALGAFRRSGETVPIAPLIRALDDANAWVRQRAAATLEEFGPEAAPAIEPLIACLWDNEQGPEPGSRVFVRATAARALGKIGPRARAAVPRLAALSTNADPYLRMEAHIALWRIQRDARQTLPRLTNDLSTVDEHSKWQIFEALAEMGPAAQDAIPAITPNLKSANAEVRQRAAETLWKIDPSQAPAIVRALIEPMNNPQATKAHHFSVIEGARLLGEMGAAAEAAIPALRQMLSHSAPSARAAAAEALKRIQSAAAKKTNSAAPLRRGLEKP